MSGKAGYPIVAVSERTAIAPGALLRQLDFLCKAA